MKFKIFKLTLFSLALIFTLQTNNVVAQEPSEIVLVSGVERGSYHTIAMDLKKLVETELKKNERRLERYEEDYDEVDPEDSLEIKKIERRIERAEDDIKMLNKIKLTVKPSEGSADNFTLLVKRTNTDIAFLQYDVMLDKQIEDIENTTYYTEDLRVFLPLGYEEVHLIVRTDSKIESIDDLKKMKVATGTDKSGTAITCRVMKRKTEIDWYDVPISFETAFSSLIQGTIDALFFVGAAPVERFDRLPRATKEKIRIVSIEHEALDSETGGPYKKVKIPAGKYKWANYDINSYAVKSILAVNISNESKQQHKNNLIFFEFICENLDELREDGHDVWKQVDFNYEGIDMEIYEGVEEILEVIKELEEEDY